MLDLFKNLHKMVNLNFKKIEKFIKEKIEFFIKNLEENETEETRRSVSLTEEGFYTPVDFSLENISNLIKLSKALEFEQNRLICKTLYQVLGITKKIELTQRSIVSIDDIIYSLISIDNANYPSLYPILSSYWSYTLPKRDFNDSHVLKGIHKIFNKFVIYGDVKIVRHHLNPFMGTLSSVIENNFVEIFPKILERIHPNNNKRTLSIAAAYVNYHKFSGGKVPDELSRKIMLYEKDKIIYDFFKIYQLLSSNLLSLTEEELTDPRIHLFGVNLNIQDPSENINFMNNQNIFKPRNSTILDKNDTYFTSDRTLF